MFRLVYMLYTLLYHMPLRSFKHYLEPDNLLCFNKKSFLRQLLHFKKARGYILIECTLSLKPDI